MPRVWSRVDLVLRFVYVLVAPVVLVASATVIPMTGVLVGVGLATIVALAGSERWRAATAAIPLAGRFLGNMANLGDYYREHPPKPLLYYIAYPLLAPYWLFQRDARREFLLYRKLNAVALVMIPAFGAYEYLTKWRPEIPVAVFLTQAIAIFVLQLLATFALVMPVVTTIVVLHTRGLRRALGALLAIALVLAVLATVGLKRKDRPDHFTAKRMAYRAHADTARAGRALTAAVQTVAQVYKAFPDDHARARTALELELQRVWRADEARLFRLYRATDGTIIVYINLTQKPTIWLGRLPDGKLTIDPARLPPDARSKLARPRAPKPTSSASRG